MRDVVVGYLRPAPSRVRPGDPAGEWFHKMIQRETP